MGAWWSKLDFDDVFAYQTSKIVIIKDRWLGLLRLAMVLVIILYIVVYVMYMHQGYLMYEVPVGILYTSLLKPNSTINTTTLDYCNQFVGPMYQKKLDSLDCVIWDEADVLYPVDETEAMLITTRISTTPQVRNCEMYAPTCSMPWKSGNKTSAYIAGIETFTIMVKHSFQARQFFQDTGDSRYSKSSVQMSGTLKNYQGQLVRHFENGQADVLSIQDILDASGTSLSNITDGASSGSSMRNSGIIILIGISYENTVLDSPTYTYQVSRVPKNEYKVVQITDDGSDARIYDDRHGIKIIFVQSGRIGKFDLQTALMQLVTSLGLLSISTLVVDNIMLLLMPLRAWYNKYKFQETVDFSEIKEFDPQEFRIMSDDQFNHSIHQDISFLKRQRSVSSSR